MTHFSDYPGYEEVWTESFDNGVGRLSNTWGNVDTSVPGQVTLTSSPDFLQDSGTMVPATGPEAGDGYGLYLFTLSTSPGDAPGPYALLWPGTNVWPGPELDVFEQRPGTGQPYSAVHWDDNGNNAYNTYDLGDVDPTQVHTYGLEWRPDELTGYVDGEERWSTTEQVPRDYNDGGQNSAVSVGMQTWWAVEHQNGPNALTVYEVSYGAWVGSDGGNPGPVDPGPVGSGGGNGGAGGNGSPFSWNITDSGIGAVGGRGGDATLAPDGISFQFDNGFQFGNSDPSIFDGFSFQSSSNDFIG